MKWKPLTAALLSSALLVGCAIPSGDFCDLSEPILFDTPASVVWLSAHDENLLRDIVAHNEQVERSCG